MATNSDTRGSKFRDRIFAWYWRRQAARAQDKTAAHRLLLRRRAELDALAGKLEARLAQAAAPNAGAPGDEGAIWTHRSSLFSVAIPEGSALGAPESGVALGDGVTFHHEASGDSVFTLAQRVNPAPVPANRFSLTFESFEFDSSYLSYVFPFPKDLRAPGEREMVRLTVASASSRPVRAFVRLNIAGSGGRETMYQETEIKDGPARFDFDLSFAPFPITGEENFWVDFIIDRPRMISFTLEDAALSLWPEGAA